MEVKSLITTLAVAIPSTLLIACGGGADTTTDTAIPPSPIEITSSSWKKTSNKSLDAINLQVSTSTKEKTDNQLQTHIRHTAHFNISGVDGKNIDDNKHWQIYIDMDNNKATGYQGAFNGSDYLIQNGYIYQSTANDKSWSWKELEISRSNNGQSLSPYIPEITVDKSSNHLQINLLLDYLDDNISSVKAWSKLCKNINIGYTEFDQNWQIDTYYPLSNQLLNKTVEYCNEAQNQAPEIELIGLESIVLDYGTSYVEPGVIATDKEDGDITHLITTKILYQQVGSTSRVPVSEVGPELGNYLIKYHITDSAGDFIYRKRYVDIIDPAQNQPPEIKLISSGPIVLDYGTPYVEPGVIATDREDGDITHLVTTEIFYQQVGSTSRVPVSEVGPELGLYLIMYHITDRSGVSRSKGRYIDIISPAKNQIVIDGNGDEWSIDQLSNADGLSNHKDISFYGTEDEDNIILMVKADDLGENTQIFINTNSPTSGYQLDVPASEMGAKILIENDLAYYYDPTNASTPWSWSWKPAPTITVARSTGVLEISYPKNMIINSTHDYVDLAFLSMDENWKNRKNSIGEDLVIGTYRFFFSK